MVFRTVGMIVLLEAALLLLPFGTSLIYGETKAALSFLETIGIAVLFGGGLYFLCKTDRTTIYAKEGFVVTALTWILLSLIGALPFTLSGEIPSYIDAVFETASGFSTTGATILADPAVCSHGILFWRSFTHWLGGMGVLVLMVALLPAGNEGRPIHILRAEMPGPTMGKLVPKLKDTAKILYILYLALTGIEVVFLLCGGMSLFEALTLSFGTAGTGGLALRADSIASYSAYLQWVITVFMFLFGINFNLYYLILIGRAKQVFKNEELLTYVGIVIAAAVMIALNVRDTFATFGEAIRAGFFQTVAFVTTTGYSTAPFDSWPVFSKTILFTLMFIGGCAGSTGGGLKVARILLMFKTAKRDLTRMLHSRSVPVVRMDGRPVEEDTVRNLGSYLMIYFIFFLFFVFVLSFEKNFDLLENITAVSACLNNIGPGFGKVSSTCAGYSDVSKCFLSLAMLIGRLEIYPILFCFIPSTWIKK